MTIFRAGSGLFLGNLSHIHAWIVSHVKILNHHRKKEKLDRVDFHLLLDLLISIKMGLLANNWPKLKKISHSHK